jgi:hypothetical protein
MKTLVPFLLAAFVALAGCVEEDATADRDPTTGPSTPNPTSTPTTSSSPLPLDTDDEDVATDPEWPGLRLVARLSNQDDAHRIVARASNDGQRTYQIEEMCSGPWRLSYATESGTAFSPQQPMGSCAAFSLTDFAPGESDEATFWWNETRWNDDDRRVEQVPPGTYVWSVDYVVWDEQAQDKVTLSTTFEIVVE